MWIYRYALVPRRTLSALAGTRTREGALLRVGGGFADIHPWPELGDAPLDERTQALVLAAREAMGNAARHAGVEEVSVFLDAGDTGISVYVRDRGAGFDPNAVAADRRGVAESVRGRMERVGGTARIVSAPGEGTEVELKLS